MAKPRSRLAQLRETPESDADFHKTWGISKQEEARLLSHFCKLMASEAGPMQPFMDELYMRRFLRARGHDVAHAKKMFLKHLAWRKQNDVDRVLDDFVFEERDAVLSIYPQGYHKTDLQGRPVYIQHLGQVNLSSLTSITTEDRMLRYHVQEYERCLRYIFPACSLVSGHLIGTSLTILDLKGVSMRQITGETQRILKEIISIDSDNYPETLGATLIINSPMVFKIIWQVIKPILDARTLSKIKVLPKNYISELQKFIPIENIPTYLGGKSKGSLIDDSGPWQDKATVDEINMFIAEREAAYREARSGGVNGASPAAPVTARRAYPPGSPASFASPAPGASPIASSVPGASPARPGTPRGASPAPSAGGLAPSQLAPGVAAAGSAATAAAAAASAVARKGAAPPLVKAPSRLARANATDERDAGRAAGATGAAAATAPIPAGQYKGAAPPRAEAAAPRPAGEPAGEESDEDEDFFDARARRDSMSFASAEEEPSGGSSPEGSSPTAAGAAGARAGWVRGGENGEAGGVGGPSLGPSDDAGASTIGSTAGLLRGGGGSGPDAAGPGEAQPQNPRVPLLARVRALEQRLPAAARPLRRQVPSSAVSSSAIGTGTLNARIAALEHALDVLVAAQAESMRAREVTGGAKAGDAADQGCCSLM